MIFIALCDSYIFADSMPSIYRTKTTLRLQYWHQSPIGQSKEHNSTLRNFLRDWLLLDENKTLSKRVDVRSVAPETGTGRPRGIVPVQVRYPSLTSIQSTQGAAKVQSKVMEEDGETVNIARLIFSRPILCTESTHTNRNLHQRNAESYGTS